MSDREWRTSFLNHLLKVSRGEEPDFLTQALHDMQGKGHFGEYLTEYALKNGNLPGRLRTWSNLLVPKQKDSPVVDETEIDVIMLHERGVFVFESKNYSGWIFGSESDRTWTQALGASKRNRFYNPILQNSAHVKVLSERLVVPEDCFTSYIVFSDRCELKKVPPDGEGYRICHRDDMLDLLREDLGRGQQAFNALQFSTLAQRIEELASASTEEAQFFHAQDVQVANSGRVCPRCGGRLMERNGRYGPFLGCSNYPRCRYTRNDTC